MARTTPHRILFDVSGHGLGHLAISAPVIGRIRDRHPSTEVIVRTSLPESRVREFVGSSIPVLGSSGEVTPHLINAVTTDLDATAAALHDLTLRFDAIVAQEREVLTELAPDLVVCNVSYLMLAAAQTAGIRNMALCCMNWADVFASMEIAHTFSDLIRRLNHIYAKTECFLQPMPHMDMPALPNRKSIGPISRCGVKQATRLAADLGVSPGTRLVLYSLGGIMGPTEINLPSLPNTHWIVADPKMATRADITPAQRLGWPFQDLLASVDAIVGKDSYGTVTEAACAGIPFVMIPRATWPETPSLIDWANRNCSFALAASDGDAIAQALAKFASQPRPPPVFPSGIDDAVVAILGTPVQ